MPREDCRSTLKYNCKLRANRTLQSDYESGSPAHGRAADALKQKLQPKALRYEQAPPASTAARRALRLHTRATQCHACAVYGLWSGCTRACEGQRGNGGHANEVDGYQREYSRVRLWHRPALSTTPRAVHRPSFEVSATHTGVLNLIPQSHHSSP